MPTRCREIDSEDEAWQGVIDPSVFQQVRDQQEKQRIVAKLEAQNRPGRPGEGHSSGSGYAVHSGESSASSKEGGKGYTESAKKGLPVGKLASVILAYVQLLFSSRAKHVYTILYCPLGWPQVLISKERTLVDISILCGEQKGPVTQTRYVGMMNPI